MIDKFMDWFFDKLFKAYEMIRDACIIIIVFAFLIITLPLWILPFIFWLFFVWEEKDTDVSKQTNADRIRSMSDEELAVFLCKVKADYQWEDHEFPSEEECGEWEEWIQLEVEE